MLCWGARYTPIVPNLPARGQISRVVKKGPSISSAHQTGPALWGDHRPTSASEGNVEREKEEEDTKILLKGYKKKKKENGRRHLKLKLETRLYFSGAVLRRRGVLFIDQILGLK